MEPAVIRYWWAVLCWAVTRVGYWIRPYDLLADARRWFWQPQQRCGGVIHGPRDLGDDSVPFLLSPGRRIADPDEAEALGLTVEARWLRWGRRSGEAS